MMIMITAVVIVDGRCRFIKLHELSTDVEFLIWSATSFVGGGGREALHIRVSQKIQKSEFWNATYPSGFHRLDEPPEKISTL